MAIWPLDSWIKRLLFVFLKESLDLPKKAHCSLRKLTYCWKDTRHDTWSATSQPLSVKLKKSITPLIFFVLYIIFFLSFFFFFCWIVHVHMVYLYKAEFFITGITIDHHLPYLHGFSLKAHMFNCFGSSRISSSSPYPSQETEQKYEKEEVPSYCRYHISPATPLQ